MKTKRILLLALLVSLVAVSSVFGFGQRPAAVLPATQAGLPDLVIEKYQVIDAKLGKIKLLIKNQGSANAPAGQVDIWLPIKPGSDEHYPRDQVAVAKGQSVWTEITIGYNVSGRKFYAWTDWKQIIKESNEYNNRIVGNF